MNNIKFIAGFDPGLAKFGLVVTDYDLNIVEFKCIKTQKGKRRLVAEDMFERGQNIAREIEDIFSKYNISLMCAEAMSYPRASSAAAKMSLTWGILCDISERKKIPLIMDSPQNIKKTLTGVANASKDQVKKAVEELGFALPKMNKTEYEHPTDALAAIISCRNTQIFRAIIWQRKENEEERK